MFPISPLQASARLHDLLYLEQKDSLCNGCGFMKFPIPHISNISCLPYHKSFMEYSKVLSHLLHMSFNNPKPLQRHAMRVHGSLHNSIIFSIVWVEYVFVPQHPSFATHDIGDSVVQSRTCTAQWCAHILHMAAGTCQRASVEGCAFHSRENQCKWLLPYDVMSDTSK